MQHSFYIQIFSLQLTFYPLFFFSFYKALMTLTSGTDENGPFDGSASSSIGVRGIVIMRYAVHVFHIVLTSVTQAQNILDEIYYTLNIIRN